MKHLLLILLLTKLLLIAGCNSDHLDIFPPLEDPQLTERTLSVEALHADIDAFITQAMATHPDMAAYADMNAIKQEVNRLKASIDQPLNRVEFFQQVGQLNRLLGDGHSLLLWPYPEYEQLTTAGHKPFPFDVVVSQSGTLHLKHGYQYEDITLPAGAHIAAINGIPATSLLETLQRYVGGESRLLREQVVSKRLGRSLWASMGLLDNFTLELQLSDNTRAIEIRPEQSWERLNKPSDDSESRYFRQIDDDIGYLYIEHFDVPPAEFELFVDQSFESVRDLNIRSLIIDIRDNPGGNTDTVTYLARYLADRRFRLVSSMREKLNEDNRGFLGYRGAVGDILVTDWNEWVEPMDTSEKFQGDSYLLMGPVTYSASIVLATTLQDYSFATLVGSPTGGFANQTAQGNLFNLPNSQLRAYIATRTLVRPSGDASRHVVQPEHIVHASEEDIANEKDAVMAYTLELIAQSKHGI